VSRRRGLPKAFRISKCELRLRSHGSRLVGPCLRAGSRRRRGVPPR
jgi:hypothetical protein